MKKEYDMIFSLGANCSAAKQLQHRGLRRYSLPFDWTYFTTEKALDAFMEGLKNNFADFLHFENMRVIPEEELIGASKHKSLYEDTATRYRFIHHFPKNHTQAQYDDVVSLWRKRVQRFYHELENSNDILILLCSFLYIDDSYADRVLNCFETLYPGKRFTLHMVNFCSPQEEHKELEKISIHRYVRTRHDYDFFHTSYEWGFLDDIALKSLPAKEKKFIDCKALKRGWGISLLPRLRTIICLSGYVFGLQFSFSIGKFRQIKEKGIG